MKLLNEPNKIEVVPESETHEVVVAGIDQNGAAVKEVVIVRDPLARPEIGTGDDVCSNFDGVIIEEVAEQLKVDPTIYADYPGWNFHGSVWYADGQFHCEVWVYNSPREIISEDDMESIRESVCQEYGHD